MDINTITCNIYWNLLDVDISVYCPLSIFLPGGLCDQCPIIISIQLKLVCVTYYDQGLLGGMLHASSSY